MGFHWFEFAAGTTWVNDIAGDVAAAAANPNLTGLTGTNLVMAAKAQGVARAAGRKPGHGRRRTVEILDHFVEDGHRTDGYWVGIAYQDGYTSASYQPTCTMTNGADHLRGDHLGDQRPRPGRRTDVPWPRPLDARAAIGEHMARYSAGMTATGAGTSVRPIFALTGSTATFAGVLREVGLFNTTAVNCVYRLVTFTGGTAGAATVNTHKHRPIYPTAIATPKSLWTADATIVTDCGYRMVLGAAIGSGRSSPSARKDWPATSARPPASASSRSAPARSVRCTWCGLSRPWPSRRSWRRTSRRRTRRAPATSSRCPPGSAAC